ncbi:unnamed protein product [Peronospora farinosa]|uniref:WRKY19-like zinc finger domain-containing protein n=1 Tax=Peronospora farinosa TaxID=134698 RepID=A0AAV0U0C5_9STRA|nr:unnamed protein product [Peronospora farinosa]
MSEVAESKPVEQGTLVLQPPTGSEGKPIREWIDTLLQAAVIAKSKQKKPEQDEVSTATTATITDVDASTTDAASFSASLAAEGIDMTDTTTSGTTNEIEKKKDELPTHPDTKDTSVVLNSDATKAEEGASAPAIKHYRRRRCEVEGCNKFARFNNACSGHGGRRLCAETGCKRVAQFGHKCSAHGGVKLCSVEGCHRAVQSRGCCKTHGGGVRCQHPDCTKGAISKGFCRSHGGGLRCAEQECHKWAQRHGYCVRHSKSAASPKAVPIMEPMMDSPTASQYLVPQTSSSSI